jgi:hypothetical protein
MSATLLEPPRPRTPLRDPPRAAPPGRRPPSGRASHGRAIAFGVALSVLIHFIIFLTIRFDQPPVGAAPHPAARALNPSPPGLRVYDITPVAGEAAPLPTPEQQVAPSVSTTLPVLSTPLPVTPSDRTTGVPATSADPVSVAERIRLRTGDPRLWERPDDPLPMPLDKDEIVRMRVYARLQAMNDSMAAAGEAAAKALDWTVKDRNGGKWGVSPSGVHLGSITIPIPVQFAPPPGRREEYATRMRQWSEAQDQAARAQVRGSFDDRVKAIRERKDAERDSVRAAAKKSGSN